jgi:Flagellar biosynthesis protein, FliO
MEMFAPYMNMAVTTLLILAGLIAALLFYRALNRSVKGRRGARLGISEYYEIDKTRRLVLVRRDDTEHLLLIGGSQDIVVEADIASALMSAPSMQSSALPPQYPTLHTAPQQGTNIQPMPMRPPPRPAIFGDRRPPLRSVEPMMAPHQDNDEP